MASGSEPLRIGALCGSLRARSTNKALVRAFARNAPPDVAVDTDMPIADLPLFNPDLEANAPRDVVGFARRIEGCDGLIVASPEYAHGMTGALKNALDWLVSRSEIPYKPVMLVHASARSGTSREHLREVLRTMSCNLFEGDEFALHLIGKSPDEAAALLDAKHVRARIYETLSRFAAFIRASQLPD